MLKINIRPTFTRKLRKPDGLISMRRPKPPAITVRTIPAAREINHAGKYDPKTSIDGTCFWGEPQLSKKSTPIKISDFRMGTEKDFRGSGLAGGFKGSYFLEVGLAVFEVFPNSPMA